MEATLDAVKIDEQLAIRIIRGMVRIGNKKKGTRPLFNLFRSFPEYRDEDIEQEAMVNVLRQWGEYDPIYAQSTFITQRAYTSIIDLHRRAKSGRNKIKRLMTLTKESDLSSEDEPLEEPSPVEAEDIDQPLTEWLTEAQTAARKMFPGSLYKRGRKHYNISQLVALALLMRRFNLSTRRCEKMLATRPELLQALKMRRVPTYRSLHRALKALHDFAVEHANRPESVTTSPDAVTPGEG